MTSEGAGPAADSARPSLQNSQPEDGSLSCAEITAPEEWKTNLTFP